MTNTKQKNRILNFKKRNTQIEYYGKAENILKIIFRMSLDKNTLEKILFKTNENSQVNLFIFPKNGYPTDSTATPLLTVINMVK